MNKLYSNVIFTSLFFMVAALMLSLPAKAALNSSFGLGTSSPQVQELQQSLTNLNYYSGPITGYFGPLTQAAVIQFQKVNSIFPQSGYVGELTRAKLNTDNGTSTSGGAVIIPPTPSPTPTVNINPNSSNSFSPSPVTSSGGSALSNAKDNVKNFAVSGIDFSDSFRPEDIKDLNSVWENIKGDPFTMLLKTLLLKIKVGTKNNKIENEFGEGSKYLANTLSANRGYGRHELTSIPWSLDWQDCPNQELAKQKLITKILAAFKEDKQIKINIVTHSHGTVIAYNALKWLETYYPDIKVNNFISLGTIIGPLNILSVSDQMCLSIESFAKLKNVETWVNVYSQCDHFSKRVEIADENVPLPSSLGFSIFPACHGQYYQDETLTLPILQCTGEGRCPWKASPTILPTVSSPTSVPPTPISPTPTTNTTSAAQAKLNTLLQQVALLQNQLWGQQNNPTVTPTPTPSSPTPISSPPPASATSPYNVLPPSGSSGGSGGSVGSSGGGGGGTISRPNTSVILNPLVFVSPSSGVAGTTFSEPGRGFTPNSTATLHFRKPDGIEYPILNIQTDGSGNYENSWTSSRTSQTGAYIYWTIDTTGLISSTATFRIIAAQQMSQTQTNTPVPSPVAPPSPAAPGMSALQPPISAPIVNPMLYLLPTSGAKGTKFTFAGIKFTPNGVIREIITKPNGTQYAPNYYTANTDGNHDKAYDSSTASIFGTYTIYWVDESTGSRSNTVYETISAY